MANVAKNAVKNATKAAAKAPEKAAAAPTVSEFQHKLCEVTGGKKNKGETVKVYFATVKPNRYGDLIARAELSDGEQVWFNQKHLTVKGDMTKADIDRLENGRKAETEETLFIAANVGVSKDTAHRLDYSRWVKNIWFPSSMIAKTNATLADENKTPIYEIAAWKVKKEAGAAAYDELVAKQPELEALVNKAG